MSQDRLWLGFDPRAGLLVDTNLLVLFIVGTVNRRRIESFKRTRHYTREDYDLLVRVLDKFKPLYTIAHVLAEVSNLTDLTGTERRDALRVLKDTLFRLKETEMPSTEAVDHRFYGRVGLTDAAIAAAARKHKCAVLTDDFDLYHSLVGDEIVALNFTYLRQANWGI